MWALDEVDMKGWKKMREKKRLKCHCINKNKKKMSTSHIYMHMIAEGKREIRWIWIDRWMGGKFAVVI